MHEVHISDDVLTRIRQQRGDLHVFERIDPRRTAHVIVDLQNGFMEPGAPVEVPTAREIVGNVNRISAALRDCGGHNFFLRMTVNEESLSSWSNWFKHLLGPVDGAAIVRAFAENAHYWKLWPELQALSGDTLVNKTRFGAFVPGASRLHELLQMRNIDTLIITGTLSNCCCESTARDAMQMNYKIVFVADANAALSDQAHNATLDSMAALFGDVMTTDQVVQAIGSARAPNKATQHRVSTGP
jgi:ureidoacrylate peracid hydrolase